MGWWRVTGLKRGLDGVLLGLALALAILGVVLVYSATFHQASLSHLALRQSAWVLVGLIAAWVFFSVDYQALVARGYGFYGVVLVALLLLIFVGKRSTYGATRWADLRYFYLQPAEFAKLGLILGLAKYLSVPGRRVDSWIALAMPLGLGTVMGVLILRQPSLGTAMVLIPITGAMLYVAGARLWQLMVLVGAGIGSFPLLWHFLKDYQKRRVMTFLEPDSDALGAGYNVIQSQIAVGSGGVWGKGFLQGTQSQLHFVPFHHTDFVFSVIAEELGLAGVLLLLGLYFGLLARLADIAANTRERSGALVCVGILAMLATQMAVNIGMTIGLAPVTGLPLPLVSYGGSSTVVTLACIGIALNVHRESRGA